MQGSRTPPAVEKRFREEYLIAGVVLRAAKKVGIAHSTGNVLAGRAWKDKKFVKAWEELRAIDVPTLRALVVEAAVEVQGRVMTPDLKPEQLAKIAVKHGLKSFSYQNPKPQYFRGLVQAFDSLSKPRDENGSVLPSGPATVQIVVSATSSDEAKKAAAAEPDDENGD